LQLVCEAAWTDLTPGPTLSSSFSITQMPLFGLLDFVFVIFHTTPYSHSSGITQESEFKYVETSDVRSRRCLSAEVNPYVRLVRPWRAGYVGRSQKIKGGKCKVRSFTTTTTTSGNSARIQKYVCSSTVSLILHVAQFESFDVLNSSNLCREGIEGRLIAVSQLQAKPGQVHCSLQLFYRQVTC